LAQLKGDNTLRWGSRCLRGGDRKYSPCVLDRTGWENYYTCLPLDYDVLNDPVFDLHRSTYYRLGDLGLNWPEPTTREQLRRGYCGPDQNSLTRPAFLREITNDLRPEPAFRTHLTDRTSLRHLRADSLEGVLPYGRQGDMSKARSITHIDYKWRQKCCAPPMEQEKPPTYEYSAYRFIKNDLHPDNPANLEDRVVKFQDENTVDDFKNNPLRKLKKAYYWPVNPITRMPLGGSLSYYPNDSPCPTTNEQTAEEPLRIPECRCELLAHGQKKEPLTGNSVNWCVNPAIQDPRCLANNCSEEIAYRYCDDAPAECCFETTETKNPENDTNPTCPPQLPCPNIPNSLTQCQK